MEDKEETDAVNTSIPKPSNKYKEDNPQAPDKADPKAASKKHKKALSKKFQGSKGTASPSFLSPVILF